MARIRIGVSGWSYREWRETFYPPGLRRADELEYTAGQLDSVEVNGTFYRLTSPSAVRHWRDRTPDDFCFAVKGSRFITHNKKLLDPREPLANFLAAGVLELNEKLGPILWQFPGGWKLDQGRLAAFLALLPTDTRGAAKLAGEHDDRVSDAAFGDGENRPLRYVVELRHPDALTADVVDILRHHDVALAFSHSAEWPYVEELTASFVYVRLHGPDRLYSSAYGQASLERWAQRVLRWSNGRETPDAARITGLSPPVSEGRDVYVYFDNDAGGHAPREALELKRMVTDQMSQLSGVTSDGRGVD